MGETINLKILGGIVGSILLGWFVLYLAVTPAEIETPEEVTTETPAPIEEATLPPVEVVPVSPPKAPVPTANKPVSLSYQKALELYKENKRIQLSGDVVCQASPNNVMYKNGTSFMIDNRTAKTLTVKVGSTYNIEPYGFRVVTLTSGVLPVTYLLDCGNQQNVAKIVLQK